jgi:hypothetical protein
MNGSSTRPIVADYVQYCLERKSLTWHGASRQRDETDEIPNQLRTTMRFIGKEFEERYTQVFSEMCRQLHVTPNNAHSTYDTVVGELFSDGISWGRVVALIAFAGSLAVECVEKEMPSLVDHVVTWTSQYIDSHLTSWIRQNGNWEGFVAFYADASNHRIDVSWPSLRTVCGYALGAVGVLAFGAVLARNS